MDKNHVSFFTFEYNGIVDRLTAAPFIVFHDGFCRHFTDSERAVRFAYHLSLDLGKPVCLLNTSTSEITRLKAQPYVKK